MTYGKPTSNTPRTYKEYLAGKTEEAGKQGWEDTAKKSEDSKDSDKNKEKT